MKHYVTFYNDYGDIIKSTLSKALENNKTNCAKTMVQALIYKFSELRDQSLTPIDRNGDDLHSIKVRPCKKYLGNFGHVDPVRYLLSFG